MADDTRRTPPFAGNLTRALRGPLVLVTTDDAWALPEAIIPFQTSSLPLIRALTDAAGNDELIVITNDPDEFNPKARNEAAGKLAVACSAMRIIHLPDGALRLVGHGVCVVRIDRVTMNGKVPFVTVTEIPATADATIETVATARSLNDVFSTYVSRHPTLPDELRVAAANAPGPGALAAMVAIHSNFPRAERQAFLAEPSLRKRLERLLAHLRRELDIMKLSSQIQQRVMSDLEGRNREVFLREQIRQIQNELEGGKGSGDDDLESLKKRVAAAGLPPAAAEEATRELRRLDRMHPSSAEYGVIRGYLDWMVELPWGKFSKDRIDLRASKKQLDGDHFALNKVKERILEFLAVRKLNPNKGGQILCLAGPPGVGKTSLGRSIAAAMAREFVRMSVGGVHDEGEIRGHRRTYVGAMPGKVLQLLRRCKTSNPVFLIDEIDKLGSDYRGDPSSALLEVLDPEQNNSFVDHYLNVPYDLSRVFFIATANRTDTIPPALRDRLEIIEINGYTREEKAQIAARHLLPRAAADHGLSAAQLKLSLPVLRTITDEYTREAGVRSLEKRIHAIARKVARGVAETSEASPARRRTAAKTKAGAITLKQAREMLGPPPHTIDEADRPPAPGLAVGLAWTPTGGDILYVEAAAFASEKADGKLILTGQMGEVMREACEAGYTYLRSHAKEYGIPAEAFSGRTFHLHIPAGAIPKDGPSAGITTTVALYSLLTGRTTKPKTAMTGEITSHGAVLPIGGLTEKILAARRAGIKRVLLPDRNAKDLSEVPDEGKQGMTFLTVSDFDDVVGACF